jgi:hypothetical protein
MVIVYANGVLVVGSITTVASGTPVSICRDSSTSTTATDKDFDRLSFFVVGVELRANDDATRRMRNFM